MVNRHDIRPLKKDWEFFQAQSCHKSAVSACKGLHCYAGGWSGIQLHTRLIHAVKCSWARYMLLMRFEFSWGTNKKLPRYWKVHQNWTEVTLCNGMYIVRTHGHATSMQMYTALQWRNHETCMWSTFPKCHGKAHRFPHNRRLCSQNREWFTVCSTFPMFEQIHTKTIKVHNEVDRTHSFPTVFFSYAFTFMFISVL
jgi:hypothetical protein